MSESDGYVYTQSATASDFASTVRRPTLVRNLRTYFHTFSYVIIPYHFGFLNPIKTVLF